LPEVVPSSGVLGFSDPRLTHRALPIAGVAGDQQAATFGQACFQEGMAKNTYGTGCFLMRNAGQTVPESSQRLLATLGWRIDQAGVGRNTYALEGSVFMGGAIVQWLRDGLGIIDSAAEVETLAGSAADAGGVVLVPAFTGLGAPYWDGEARGLLIGLTRGSHKAHIARAALDAIALQTVDLVDAMNRDLGAPLNLLRVDGGASRNDLLMQRQADLLGVPVLRPAQVETTALGAAWLAGLSLGCWSSEDELAALWHLERCFEPSLSADERESTLDRWHRAVARCRHWQTTA
jgi:glycerol kinase